MLELKNVSKSYGKQQALKNINLSIPQGEIIGLFGENGAGKTTLMKCVFGFLPYKGDITLNGEKITNKNIEALYDDYSWINDVITLAINPISRQLQNEVK